LKVYPLLAQLKDHSALKVRPLLSGFLGFQAYTTPRCCGGSGEVKNSLRGVVYAKENLFLEQK
jgi:hypothetical protein